MDQDNRVGLQGRSSENTSNLDNEELYRNISRQFRNDPNCGPSQNLSDLFKLIYDSDFQLSEFSKEFYYFFNHIEELELFYQILYDSISIYLQKTKSQLMLNLSPIVQEIQSYKNGHNLAQNYKSYMENINLLLEMYDRFEEKSIKIQTIVDYMSCFSNHHYKIIQKVNCQELHHTQFIEKILKDEQIKEILNWLHLAFQDENKHFLQTKTNLQKLQSIKNKKQKPIIQQTTIYKNIQIDKPQLNQQKPVENNNIDIKPVIQKKKNKKNQKSSKKPFGSSYSLLKFYVDEVKEFEKKLEDDFEKDQQKEKVQLKLPDEWLLKLKNKLIQNSKSNKQVD